jgi:hypothetical protein
VAERRIEGPPILVIGLRMLDTRPGTTGVFDDKGVLTWQSIALVR